MQPPSSFQMVVRCQGVSLWMLLTDTLEVPQGPTWAHFPPGGMFLFAKEFESSGQRGFGRSVYSASGTGVRRQTIQVEELRNRGRGHCRGLGNHSVHPGESQGSTWGLGRLHIKGLDQQPANPCLVPPMDRETRLPLTHNPQPHSQSP